MLALKSYMHDGGFSVMDADELYFINGGSNEHFGDTRSHIPPSISTVDSHDIDVKQESHSFIQLIIFILKRGK